MAEITGQNSNSLDDEAARLRRNVRDQPSFGPEDTRTELMQEAKTEDLRERITGIAGTLISPESTLSEILAEELKIGQSLEDRMKEDQKQPFNHFRFYDPRSDVDYRFATSESAIKKADELGSTGFQYTPAPGSFEPISKVDGQWLRANGEGITKLQETLDQRMVQGIEERAQMRTAAGASFANDGTLARLDTEEFRRIQDPVMQRAAATEITSSARTYPAYQAELGNSVLKPLSDRIFELEKKEVQNVMVSDAPAVQQIQKQDEALLATKKQVHSDVLDHKILEGSGVAGDSAAQLLRSNMRGRSDASEPYLSELKATAPELAEQLEKERQAQLASTLSASKGDGVTLESLPTHKAYYVDEPGQAGVQLRSQDGKLLDFGGRESLDRFIEEQGISAEDARTLREIDGQADKYRSGNANFDLAASRPSPEDMQKEFVEESRNMTPARAQLQATNDVKDHAEIDKLGETGQSFMALHLSDMKSRADNNQHYEQALQKEAPDLYAQVMVHGQERDAEGMTAAEAKADAALSAAKDDRKNLEADAMARERIEDARNMTPEQAKAMAKRDMDDHAGLEALGERGVNHSDFLRGDMQERVDNNEHYREALKDAAPELFARVQSHGQDVQVIDVAANVQAAEVKADAQLSAEKDDRKEVEADEMLRERLDEARKMTPEQAEVRAIRDARDHADFEAMGPRGDSYAYYLRGDMQERMDSNPNYRMHLEKQSPELFMKVALHGQENETVDVAANVRAANAAAAEEEKRRKAIADQLNAANSFATDPSGKHLAKDEFIMPRSITAGYVEHEGKFVSKKTNIVAFEDNGNKLATSTVDKKTIADMVALAHAKQWDSLKLAGSKEFRKEAWLQAESQGIKTVGYTPRAEDMSELEALRQSKATNLITPLQERKTQEKPRGAEIEAEDEVKAKAQTKAVDLKEPLRAPRNDVSSNPAVLDEAAKKSMTSNFEALRSNPKFENRSTDDLTKLAYWRGIVNESNKHQPPEERQAAVSRFDEKAQSPQFLAQLPQDKTPEVAKPLERTQSRDSQEMSL